MTEAKNDRVLRLFLINWSAGMLIGFAFAGAILGADLAGIRSLLFHSDFLLQGLALLFGGFGFTFGGVVCASAVMLIASEPES